MVEDKESQTQKPPQDIPEEEEDFVEVVPVDKQERKGEDYLLEEEEPIEKIAADERSEDIIRQQKSFTEDEDVAEDMERRQEYAYGGRAEMEEKLEQRHSASPDLTAGDVDADWESADTGSGAEAVGGTEPTPDQDVVDEIGEAVGITYEDDEPLNIEKKLRERRQERLQPPEDQLRDQFQGESPRHEREEDENESGDEA